MVLIPRDPGAERHRGPSTRRTNEVLATAETADGGRAGPVHRIGSHVEA